MSSKGGSPVAVPAIEAEGLSKRFSGAAAVDEVSLRIPMGEVYGFVGPNGAGKSTTMRMLLGLVTPTSGTARVAGHPAGTGPALAACGSLIEGPAFYKHLSGRRNLEVLARNRRLPLARVAEVLQAVGLADRADDRYTKYSLGMKQRLGIAAALLPEPAVLVLDEPTNGLDPAGVAAFRILVRRLADQGAAVMLSSHTLGEIEQVCDRVGIIKAGRLIAETRVDDIPRGTTLHLKADPTDDALAVLREIVGPDRPRATVKGIEATIDDHRPADINRALVEAGVRVTELRSEHESLEDVFLRLTSDPARSTGPLS